MNTKVYCFVNSVDSYNYCNHLLLMYFKVFIVFNEMFKIYINLLLLSLVEK